MQTIIFRDAAEVWVAKDTDFLIAELSGLFRQFLVKFCFSNTKYAKCLESTRALPAPMRASMRNLVPNHFVWR